MAVQHDRLITGIAIALAGSAALLALLAVVYSPVIFPVALALGAAAYLMWYQTSGRMARRIYRSVERQARKNADPSGDARRQRERRRRTRERGGFGAGPREDWVPPGGRAGRRTQRQRGGFGGQRRQRRQRQAPSTNTGPTEAEAYEVLDVEPGADADAVKQAYRQKVKEVHPDTDGGDEEQFKRVTRAYERLS